MTEIKDERFDSDYSNSALSLGLVVCVFGAIVFYSGGRFFTFLFLVPFFALIIFGEILHSANSFVFREKDVDVHHRIFNNIKRFCVRYEDIEQVLFKVRPRNCYIRVKLRSGKQKKLNYLPSKRQNSAKLMELFEKNDVKVQVL